MIKVIEMNDAQSQYHQYLTEHTKAVRLTFEKFIKPHLSDEQISECQSLILSHDESKYGKEEWDAYLRHFYLSDEGNDPSEFDYAWNHHIHNNPHHWQYWVLIDENRFVIKTLDMPFNYIIEMLCDWHSFSVKKPESTAYKWYQDNKDVMMLSYATKQVIEQYLEYLKEPLGGKSNG